MGQTRKKFLVLSLFFMKNLTRTITRAIIWKEGDILNEELFFKRHNKNIIKRWLD